MRSRQEQGYEIFRRGELLARGSSLALYRFYLRSLYLQWDGLEGRQISHINASNIKMKIFLRLYAEGAQIPKPITLDETPYPKQRRIQRPV